MDADLSRDDLKRLTGLCDSSIYNAMDAGILARPTHGRWTAAQFDDWLKARKVRPRLARIGELTADQVRQQTTFTRTHICRLILAEKFPRPIRYEGNHPIWDRAAVTNYIALRNQPEPDQLRLSQVLSLTGLNTWKLDYYRRAGKFPKPNYSRGKNQPRWNADEIFKYVAEHPPTPKPGHNPIIDADSNAIVAHALFRWIPDAHTDALDITGRLYLVTGHRTGRPSSIRVQRIDEIPPTVRTLWQVTPNDTAHPTYREQGFAPPPIR